MVRLFTLLIALSAGSASAEEVIATGQGGSAPTVLSQTAPAPTELLPVVPEQQVVRIGPCTPYGGMIAAQAEANGARIEPDRDMHGEISAGIGTNGYRSVSGSVCKPLGDNGYVSISAGSDRYDYDRRRR
jgi:hypothetical protein